MKNERGMVFERTLSESVLEVGYRIASSDAPFEQQRQLLAISLRDHVTEQEANDKTKKMVTRVWVNPPAEATAVIHWAVRHPEAFPDRRVMHLGAILTTYPFVGTVMTALGRAFAIEGSITGVELRRRVVASWGGRMSVELGATKTAGTLRSFGIISGGGNTGAYRPAEQLRPTGLASAWLVHGLLASRGESSIDADALGDAPELFWADSIKPDPKYPHLELHREGMHRRVWAPR